MRYKILYKGKSIEIRSENAALSAHFQSKLLLNWLEKQESVDRVLDYGCGKLRYTRALRKVADSLMLVDSKIQLERTQTILGKITTVKEFVRSNWNDVNVMDAKSFKKTDLKYDLILCSNVLSAIPCEKEIFSVLKKLRKSLKRNGRCLIVNQHRNSDFNKAKLKKESFSYSYGWVQKSYRGYSYYGIFDKPTLLKILPKAGFTKINIWIDGQSTFAECS